VAIFDMPTPAKSGSGNISARPVDAQAAAQAVTARPRGWLSKK
jgi:hypothetical protein